MTSTHFHPHDLTNFSHCSDVILFHYPWTFPHTFVTFSEQCSLILLLPHIFYKFSAGLRSELWTDQWISIRFSTSNTSLTILALWHGALSSRWVGWCAGDDLTVGAICYKTRLSFMVTFTLLRIDGTTPTTEKILLTIKPSLPNFTDFFMHLGSNFSLLRHFKYCLPLSKPTKLNLLLSLKNAYKLSSVQCMCSLAETNLTFRFFLLMRGIRYEVRLPSNDKPKPSETFISYRRFT